MIVVMVMVMAILLQFLSRLQFLKGVRLGDG